MFVILHISIINIAINILKILKIQTNKRKEKRKNKEKSNHIQIKCIRGDAMLNV